LQRHNGLTVSADGDFTCGGNDGDVRRAASDEFREARLFLELDA